MINKLASIYSIILIALILLNSNASINIMLVNNMDTPVKIEVNGETRELNAYEHKLINVVVGEQHRLFIRGFLDNVDNISWNVSCRVYRQNHKLEITMNKEYSILIVILAPLSTNISLNIVYKRIVEYAVGSGLSLFVRIHGLRQVNVTKSTLYFLNDTRYWNLLSITSLKYEDGGILVNVNVDRGRFPFIDVKRGVLELQLNNNSTCLLLISLPRIHGSSATNTTSAHESSLEYPYSKMSTVVNNYISSFTYTNTVKRKGYTTAVHTESTVGFSLPELLLLILFMLLFSIYILLEYKSRNGG